MADPYRRNPHESEDMSSFLVNLLHGSSSASDLDFRERAMADSSSSLNFSDPSRFYAADFKEGVEEDVFSKVDDFDFGLEESDVLEMPTDQVQPCSSKRSRSTEFHNLSEKRRRSKINEKLKALQNLIPNSNKTDKASMLDEAIEYLKQLQLRVQMLTTRNGLNIYPTYVPGSLHSMQLPTGIEFDGESVMLSANRGAMLLDNSDMMQTSFEISNHNPWCKQTIRRTQ